MWYCLGDSFWKKTDLEKTDKGTASPEVEGEETKELDKLMFVGRPERSYLCSN